MAAPLTHPTPSLAGLTRAQLAARVALLREMLDQLADQAALDGGPPFLCRSAVTLDLGTTHGLLRLRERSARVAGGAA
jgi:hypothetical protein